MSSNPFNPFATLFQKVPETTNVSLIELNNLLEKIFLVTIDKAKSQIYAYVGDDEAIETLINYNNLDEILIRYLQLNEKIQFNYLFECFKRVIEYSKKELRESRHEYLQKLCINLNKTLISLEEASSHSKYGNQFLDFVFENAFNVLSNEFTEFVHGFLEEFRPSEDNEDKIFIQNLFRLLNNKISHHDCIFYSTNYFQIIDIVLMLTPNTELKYEFLASSQPKQPHIAKIWQKDNLIGKLLTPHYLNKNSNTRGSPLNDYQFFTKPLGLTERDLEINENNVWQRQSLINQKQIQFFSHFIKHKDVLVRNECLKWMGACLNANKNRAQEWSKFVNTHELYASDELFLNMLIVLLDFSQPFSKCNSPLLLKIDPTYTMNEKHHFNGFNKETKFVKSNEEHVQVLEKSEYNFITECFYATMRCFQLAFVVLNQKLLKINQEVVRTQGIYQDLLTQFNHNDNADPVKHAKLLYENYTCEYFNIKTALCQPNLNEMSLKFLSAFATFMINLVFCDEKSDKIEEIKQNYTHTEYNYKLLALVPEFFLNNISEFWLFLSRFNTNFQMTLENYPSEVTNGLFGFFIVFMSDPSILTNPHSRACLAECLEVLVPNAKRKSILSDEKQLQLFTKHAAACILINAIMSVFVSIESSVTHFEQKFNYRRPMYEIIEYLLTLDYHCVKLKDMEIFASDHIESSDQPLFLRFVNLLVNDANYLLIESLLYLEKIRDKQLELDAESSTNTHEQRDQLNANLKHMIMIAKFHNIMSSKTLNALKLLTSQCGQFFCHQILVDRIATMLNDFLLHLVGPKRRKLVVKNFKEVEFNPQEIVSLVSDIYLNLGKSDEFCLAVCRDGRSYSTELFLSASNILTSIKRPHDILLKFKQLSAKLTDMSRVQSLEDMNYDDAPDEFLDPIMSHLMIDPVILPSSKKCVDRSTIARHLLSDQTDPFNRIPLTLQEVIPNDELREQIKVWKQAKKSLSSAK